MSSTSSSMSTDAGQSPPVRRLVIYRPKPGSYAFLANVLRRHGPALRAAGLITSEGVRLYRATDDPGEGDPEPYLIETFKWRDQRSMDEAHNIPEIVAIYRDMDPHLQSMTMTTLDGLT